MLDPNVIKADLMKWKVRNEAPAAPWCSGSILVILQRTNRETRAEGRRAKVFEGSSDLPMSHGCAAQQQAHRSVLMQTSTCWDVRGGSGGEVFSTPWCFPLRELLLEVPGEKKKEGGVMLMQQLMEISCWDFVLV